MKKFTKKNKKFFLFNKVPNTLLTLKKNIKDFVDSFKKIDARFLYCILFDLLGYMLIVLGFKAYQSMLAKLLIKMPDPALLQNLDPGSTQIAQILATMKGIFFWLAFYSIALFIFIFLIWCLFKGLIWNRVFNQEFTFRFYKKFLLVNLLWLAIWLVPIVLFFLFVKQNVLVYLLIIIFILMVYLTYILYIKSVKEKKIKDIIKETFMVGFKRIYCFIIPYTVMVIVFLIIMQLYWLFKGLSQFLQAVIFLLILVMFIAWSRFYMANVVENFSK